MSEHDYPDELSRLLDMDVPNLERGCKAGEALVQIDSATLLELIRIARGGLEGHDTIIWFRRHLQEVERVNDELQALVSDHGEPIPGGDILKLLSDLDWAVRARERI